MMFELIVYFGAIYFMLHFYYFLTCAYLLLLCLLPLFAYFGSWERCAFVSTTQI
jgi:hypothetical protein